MGKFQHCRYLQVSIAKDTCFQVQHLLLGAANAEEGVRFTSIAFLAASF